MNNRRLILVDFILGLAVTAGWSVLAKADDADVEDLTAQSQPELQQRISATLNSFAQGDKNQALNQLNSLRAADPAEIVKQLAIFSATVGDGEQVLRVRRILDLLNIQPAIVIQVLAPYLDAENPNLRSFVRDWFQFHDKAAAPGPGLPPLQPVNYDDYKDYVRGKLIRNEEIPEPFIEYIYEKLPSHALLVFYFANGQQARDVLLAESIIRHAIWLKENGFNQEFQKKSPDAKNELLKLAKHDEWWVRLYVAEIMREHAELRDGGVVDRLAKDSDALVAKVAKKELKPAKLIDNVKRAKAYEKLQKMIDARN